MTFRLALIYGSTLILAACGSSGPSDQTMKRACIDSGAFTMAQDKARICDCIVKQISADDADYVLQHWYAQANKNFGKSILPSSMQSIKERCGSYG
jgi:hypothetical protein